ncbi:hypothetical protein SAMN04487947_2036 [Halogeometricum rufum]|uniref:Uncharacterized protein n=1 Tax=Halogeometricum rufum TaxID=553469 RepID=A0A1I6HGT8_9EURY|nr:hypothetical protein [Halogeometricum rufum]SFR53477.1 hypothetical protein SAMN04487947_2036 [Halogeometricum rufum]
MASQTAAMDKLNIVCPECSNQFDKGTIASIDTTDYQSFSSDFSCPRCNKYIHPEDALLKYFSEIPTSEIPGRPVKIGGFASVGTIELDVGKTKEIPLIGGKAFDIGLKLLSETDQPPNQTIRDLDGTTIQWFPGPLLIDDAVIVDIAQSNDGEIAFITSERENYSSTITVAYHYHLYRSTIPQPPWVTLLSEALESYHRGHGLALYTLLFSSFENLLAREITRTLRATGWVDNPIDNFLKKYWTWEERCKGALKVITSKHFPTEYSSIYNDLCQLRETRNDEIIHVDSEDSVAEIGIQELRSSFETILDAMMAIHTLCYEKRQECLYPLGLP